MNYDHLLWRCGPDYGSSVEEADERVEVLELEDCVVKEMKEWVDILLPEDRVVGVRHRVHCRLLLKSFGRPITDFTSLQDLLEVFIDVVKGIGRFSGLIVTHDP